MDRYNNYFQYVIFVLAVTISHTDTPTTEDTPQHRDRVKAKLHARAEPQSYENVVTYPSKKFVSHVTVRPSTRPPTHPSAPQGNQFEMLRFLASVGACILILHIHVVFN